MLPIRHFFPTPPLKSKRFAVGGIGIQERRSASTTDRPTGSGDYLFMYLYEAGWLKTREGICRQEPGSMVIWRPGDQNYFGSDDGDWRHTFIHCNGSWVRRCVASCRLPYNTRIRLPNAMLLEKYLFNIYQELTLFAQPDERIVANLFENWLRDLSRSLRSAASKQAPPQEFQDLRAYIDAHFHAPLDLKSLALRAHLSIPRLCSRFKKIFSTSIMAYVIDRRMQHAAYLMQDCNLRVADVARQVGYDDPFHFSKLFKARYGLSPREFRRVPLGQQKGSRAARRPFHL